MGADTSSAQLLFLQQLQEMLRAYPAGISEYELIRALSSAGESRFDADCLCNNLSLFQTHFFLFHNLYQLHEQLWHNELEERNRTMFIIAKPLLFSMLFIMMMGFGGCRGLTHNRAETQVDHADPSLKTRNYALQTDVLFATVLEAIKTLPRWQVVSQDLKKGEIIATRTSRLFRFVDDVQIQVLEKTEREIAIDLRSASRVGKGDFGQNARNIRDFLTALDQKLALLNRDP